MNMLGRDRTIFIAFSSNNKNLGYQFDKFQFVGNRKFEFVDLVNSNFSFLSKVFI